MTESAMAMATWLGALSRPAFKPSAHQAAGLSVAGYVLGDGKLDELRGWFAFQPRDVQVREQAGAIEAVLYMAHCDRDFDPAERAFLEQIISQSGLPTDVDAELRGALDASPPLAELSDRVTQPVLREMLLALCWELAMADDHIAKEEKKAYDELALALSVPRLRAKELREALSAEI